MASGAATNQLRKVLLFLDRTIEATCAREAQIKSKQSISRIVSANTELRTMVTQTKGAGRSYRHIFVFESRDVEKNLAGSKQKQEYDVSVCVCFF